MEHSPNIAVVRRLYEARGNGDIVKETLHDDVRWEAAPGMPYGGVHLGFDTPLVGDFRDWVTAPDRAPS